MSDSRFDLPEKGQIRQLLNGGGRPVAPSGGRKGPARAGQLWGVQPVQRALGGMNWENDPARHPSPLDDGRGNVRYLRGALPARQFLGLVNWPNASSPPEWPVREGVATAVGLQSSVESMFTDITWGE